MPGDPLPPISPYDTAIPQASSVSSEDDLHFTTFGSRPPTSLPKPKQVIEDTLETLRACHNFDLLGYVLLPDAAPPNEASRHPRRTQGPTARHITA